ncbi:unnamed protein product [Porites lobata]|uniref:Fibrinogen C-terminal domain-containing protein n=1 Tax=Porites lobata TaxID=104759 RepID=A0ABN8RK30_9CNID|nr:unnamed protein product [Porites lobata]
MQFVATLKGLTTAPANLDILEIERNAPVRLCTMVKGPGWTRENPAKSCKDIRDLGFSKGDGEYWIDPGKTGNPLKVFCDMTTYGGGWLLVSRLVLSSSTHPSSLPVKNSYRGISSKQVFLTTTAMKELRKVLPFTQIRFLCKKKRPGRTFHITTAANSKGEAWSSTLAVLRMLSLLRVALSFVTMNNDNSRLARLCHKWG